MRLALLSRQQDSPLGNMWAVRSHLVCFLYVFACSLPYITTGTSYLTNPSVKVLMPDFFFLGHEENYTIYNTMKRKLLLNVCDIYVETWSRKFVLPYSVAAAVLRFPVGSSFRTLSSTNTCVCLNRIWQTHLSKKSLGIPYFLLQRFGLLLFLVKRSFIRLQWTASKAFPWSHNLSWYFLASFVITRPPYFAVPAALGQRS